MWVMAFERVRCETIIVIRCVNWNAGVREDGKGERGG